MVFGYRAIIIISLITMSVSLNCNQRNVTNIETHLKLTLLCDYEPFLVPTNFVTVNLLVELQEIYQTFYNLNGVLNLVLNYNESSLEFDPKNYDGITEITVELDDIWYPKIYFYDTDSETGIDSCNPKCIIQFSGIVICKFLCYLNALCKPDFLNWPNQKQNCSFAMFIINNYLDRVKFQTDISVGDSVGDSMEQSKWDIIAYEVYMPDIKSSLIYPVFGLTVVTGQHSYLSFYSIIYPIYSILVIVFIAFAVEFDSLLRVALIATSIFLELCLVKSIEEAFFPRPDQLPIAVTYFRLSFSTSCFLLCETLILRSLARKVIHAPQWFNYLEFLYKFSLFNFHLVSDNDKPPSQITNNLSADNLKWYLFCAILDRISFFIWIIYNACVMSFY